MGEDILIGESEYRTEIKRINNCISEINTNLDTKLSKTGNQSNIYLGTDENGNIISKSPINSGTVSQTDIQQAVDTYLTEHPVSVFNDTTINAFNEFFNTVATTENGYGALVKLMRILRTGGVLMYNITNNLSNATSSNITPQIEENNAFETDIILDDNYILTSLQVTMGGIDVTDLYHSKLHINIPHVTGDIIITVSTKLGATVVYHADILTSTVDDGSQIVDSGYKPFANMEGGDITEFTVCLDVGPATNFTWSSMEIVSVYPYNMAPGIVLRGDSTIMPFFDNELMSVWSLRENKRIVLVYRGSKIGSTGNIYTKYAKAYYLNDGIIKSRNTCCYINQYDIENFVWNTVQIVQGDTLPLDEVTIRFFDYGTGRVYGAAKSYAGTISDVRIYNSVISDIEIENYLMGV